ncbi:hypothetical protein GQX74_013184 [Glossina fuscipes]|nr:hypothetical protein GQX74_013184 [Glossina fuscipes]
MTDSMKFGPEWLRNMSADITSISSNVGQNTTSATMSSCVTTATSSTNSSTSLNSGSSLSNINNNTNQSQINLLTNTPIPRNLFPEFRYGREEMLSLFEKTCSMPEILPSYKNLYVEKVQYPLALTPSSEEEMVTQGPSLPSRKVYCECQQNTVQYSSTLLKKPGQALLRFISSDILKYCYHYYEFYILSFCWNSRTGSLNKGYARLENSSGIVPMELITIGDYI